MRKVLPTVEGLLQCSVKSDSLLKAELILLRVEILLYLLCFGNRSYKFYKRIN